MSNFYPKFAFCFTMKSYLIILALMLTNTMNAQFHTALSRSELGPIVGGTFYMGDLNPYVPFRGTNLAYGLVYRYNIHSRLSFRANFIYGGLEGDDALAKSEIRKDRNLNFHSDLYEGAAGLEFSYFPFQLGHDRYKATAYVLAEIGVFHMNPKTYTDAGDEVELRTVGTEGQGSDLNSKSQYKLTQLVIPLGIGAKFSLGKRVGMSLEFGVRKTFTDYIDDVGASSYVDPVALAAANGPLAAQLSNRSISGDRFGKRGDSRTKDWYFFAGGMITISLGNPSICYSH